ITWSNAARCRRAHSHVGRSHHAKNELLARTECVPAASASLGQYQRRRSPNPIHDAAGSGRCAGSAEQAAEQATEGGRRSGSRPRRWWELERSFNVPFSITYDLLQWLSSSAALLAARDRPCKEGNRYVFFPAMASGATSRGPFFRRGDGRGSH